MLGKAVLEKVLCVNAKSLVNVLEFLFTFHGLVYGGECSEMEVRQGAL